MITTQTIKLAVLDKGLLTVGSGPEIILLIGSCRVVPYINYFEEINGKNRFTLHAVDPVNWNWDCSGHQVNFQEAVDRQEKNPHLLSAIQKAQWFIHEHFENYGIFNSSPTSSKNIYQFGLNVPAGQNLTIPNFHDIFILFQDYITFHPEMRAEAKHSVSDALKQKVKELGLEEIEKFYRVCRQTNFPEMESIFRDNWTTHRYFWSFNHISSHFTTAIFRLLSDKFLHMEIPAGFWDKALREDMYANNYTPLTKYDVENHGIRWPEKIAPLKV